MPVPSGYRWVSVGGLTIGAAGDRPEGHPPFSVHDIITALKSESLHPKGRRLFRNGRMRMWASHLRLKCNLDYYVFLLHAADKDVVPGIYLNFETEAPRYEEKEDSEGAWYSSHILIKKNADHLGRYEILVEKLPHISFTNIAAHLNWVLKKKEHLREYQTDNGPRFYGGHVKIAGVPSTSLENALAGGKLLDIQLVERQRTVAGLDEVAQFKDVVSKKTFKVGEPVAHSLAKIMVAAVLGEAKARILEERSSLPELLLRLETSGQERTSSLEFDPDELSSADGDDLQDMATAMLTSALVLNEYITGFEVPLQQAHRKPSREVVAKILELRATE